MRIDFLKRRRFFPHRVAPEPARALVQEGCCPPAEQGSCCEAEDKAECCGVATEKSCGCRPYA